MLRRIRSLSREMDWFLVGAIVPILAAGLLTMNSFVRENYFAPRQLVWIVFSFIIFFIASQIDWRILRNTSVLLVLYGLIILVLLALFLGKTTAGVHGWF